MTPDAAPVLGKECTACGEAKPLDAFPPDRRAGDGRASRCRDCQAATMRAHRHGDTADLRAAERAAKASRTSLDTAGRTLTRQATRATKRADQLDAEARRLRDRAEALDKLAAAERTAAAELLTAAAAAAAG